MIPAHEAGIGTDWGASRVSLVTGAGAGIGASIARSLAARGDTVVCADVDGRAAAKVAASLPHATSAPLDVRDADGTIALVQSIVDDHGHIDVAVTCAGIFRRAPAHEMSEETFDEVIDVNLRGTFITAQTVGRAMIAAGTGGAMVLIGSTHSVRAMRQQAAYAASKGAVLILAKVMAVEWAKFNIRVNVVGPGFTETAATAPTRADPERLAAMMARVPMRRVGQVDEIAAAVQFLTSDDASFATGAYLNVDGGWLAS